MLYYAYYALLCPQISIIIPALTHIFSYYALLCLLCFILCFIYALIGLIMPYLCFIILYYALLCPQISNIIPAVPKYFFILCFIMPIMLYFMLYYALLCFIMPLFPDRTISVHVSTKFLSLFLLYQHILSRTYYFGKPVNINCRKTGCSICT